MTPSFQFTRNDKEWEDTAFPALLMRHGAPPAGVKWYGKQERMTLTTGEARSYVNGVINDIHAAILKHGVMCVYSSNYQKMMSRAMKNKFMRWCYEYRKANS